MCDLKIIRSTEAGLIAVVAEYKLNEDIVNNVRWETSRPLRNNKKEKEGVRKN